MKTNKTNVTKTNPTTTTIESLENRRMMSVSAVIDSQHQFNIHGTGGNDKIHVELSANRIKVYDISAHSYGKGAPLLADWNSSAANTIRIFGDYGNDLIEIGGTSPGKSVNVWGGKGNDTVAGGAGPEAIWGGPGNDYLQGGGGNDDLFGEGDNDMLVGDGPNTTVGNDYMTGGAGIDGVSYWYAKSAVKVNLEDTYANGQTGEHDILSSDIENLRGSDYNDTLRGSAQENQIWGGKGNDSIYGMTDNDSLYGEAGNDSLDGGLAGDLLVGGVGSDLLIGAPDNGHDVIWGQNQNVYDDGNVDHDVAKINLVNGDWDYAYAVEQADWIQ